MYRIFVCAMLLAVTADAPAASIDTERRSSIVKEPASDDYGGTAPVVFVGFGARASERDRDHGGAAQDIELLRTIVEDLGNSRRWPQWKAGSEFKAVREQSADVRREP
jgi:hypothetical protein